KYASRARNRSVTLLTSRTRTNAFRVRAWVPRSGGRRGTTSVFHRLLSRAACCICSLWGVSSRDRDMGSSYRFSDFSDDFTLPQKAHAFRVYELVVGRQRKQKGVSSSVRQNGLTACHRKD